MASLLPDRDDFTPSLYMYFVANVRIITHFVTSRNYITTLTLRKETLHLMLTSRLCLHLDFEGAHALHECTWMEWTRNVQAAANNLHTK